MALYKKRTAADQKNLEGGYKNIVFFAERDTFLSLAKPTVFTNLGNKLEIITDHTFTAPAGFYSWLCEKKTVKITGESDEYGDIVWTSTFALMGDSSSTQEQLENLLKGSQIFLLKDVDCLTAEEYVQLGDECSSPEVAVAFDSFDQTAGRKKYTVTLKVKGKKYWYNGTVTEAA